MIYGYARVSTDGQTLDAQLSALKAAGCTDKTTFREKISGARSEGAPIAEMMAVLGIGHGKHRITRRQLRKPMR